MGYVATAEAQEPPLDIPSAGVLDAPPDVLSYGGWLFYPEITVYARRNRQPVSIADRPDRSRRRWLYSEAASRHGATAFTQRTLTAISSSGFIHHKAI